MVRGSNKIPKILKINSKEDTFSAIRFPWSPFSVASPCLPLTSSISSVHCGRNHQQHPATFVPFLGWLANYKGTSCRKMASADTFAGGPASTDEVNFFSSSLALLSPSLSLLVFSLLSPSLGSPICAFSPSPLSASLLLSLRCLVACLSLACSRLLSDSPSSPHLLSLSLPLPLSRARALSLRR